MLTKCIECSSAISVRAAVCPKCGAAKGVECFVCNSLISPESNSCPVCGDPDPFERLDKISKPFSNSIDPPATQDDN
ncbi:double zinc ribbon domain-containing protein [Desulfogranum marinum]|uniref:double zinc ribbon domain-containing protein n=1 Tax=Desulfogranum marinum TaxID=453220 RepID=UPI0034DD4FFC